MKDFKTAWVVPLIAALAIITVSVSAIAGGAQTNERFGPWKYYAPYYFPKNGCYGICFSPDDFKPVYEDPNPLAPKGVYRPQPLPPIPGGVRKVTAAPPARPEAQRRIMRPMSTPRGQARPVSKPRIPKPSPTVSTPMPPPRQDLQVKPPPRRKLPPTFGKPSARIGPPPRISATPPPGPVAPQNQLRPRGTI